MKQEHVLKVSSRVYSAALRADAASTPSVSQ